MSEFQTQTPEIIEPFEDINGVNVLREEVSTLPPAPEVRPIMPTTAMAVGESALHGAGIQPSLTRRERKVVKKGMKKAEKALEKETMQLWMGGIGRTTDSNPNQFTADVYGQKAKSRARKMKRVVKKEFKRGDIDRKQMQSKLAAIDAKKGRVVTHEETGKKSVDVSERMEGFETGLQRTLRRQADRASNRARRYGERKESVLNRIDEKERSARRRSTESEDYPVFPIGTDYLPESPFPTGPQGETRHELKFDRDFFEPKRVEDYRQMVKDGVAMLFNMEQQAAVKSGKPFNEAAALAKATESIYRVMEADFFLLQDREDLARVPADLHKKFIAAMREETREVTTDQEPVAPVEPKKEVKKQKKQSRQNMPVGERYDLDEKYPHFLNQENMELLDSAIAEAIRKEVHSRKDARGVDKLSNEEFKQLSKEVRDELIEDYFDVEDEKVPNFVKAEVRARLRNLGRKPTPVVASEPAQSQRPGKSQAEIAYENLQKIAPDA